ncbi:hypothetical protein D3C85_1806070 [compost metagenome]
MTLGDAQHKLVSRIRRASIQGVLYSHLSFPDKVARKGEKELIVHLKAAVEEEAGHANQYQY